MILGHIELGDKDNDKLLNVAVGMISGRATTMNKDTVHHQYRSMPSPVIVLWIERR